MPLRLRNTASVAGQRVRQRMKKQGRTVCRTETLCATHEELISQERKPVMGHKRNCSPSPLDIKLFGPCEVRVQDGPPLQLARNDKKARWLLALLILRSPNPIDRETLAGLLWPDSADPLALLRGLLLALRTALGDQSYRLSQGRTPLTLDLENAQIDLIDFDRAIVAGDEPALER